MARNQKNAPNLNNSESEGNRGKKKEKTTAARMAESRAKQRQNKPREKGRIKEYFKGVRLEMKKVVWPTRAELGSFTAVVLATCIAFALMFWGIDSGVLAAIRAVCF